MLQRLLFVAAMLLPMIGYASPNSTDLLEISDVTTPHGDLICIRPDLDRLSVDLVYGRIPDANDGTIIMAFAGAFTGKMWNKGHGNVAGDHVCSGKNYCFYRAQEGAQPKYLHDKPQPKATNFVVFKVR